MSKKIEIKDVADLISAVGDSNRLYGFTPAEKYDANTFVYPIIAIVDMEMKTYVIREAKEEEKKEEVKEPVVEETPKQEEVKEPVVEEEKASEPVASSNADAAAKAKKKKIGMIVGFSILGVAVVIGIILAIYFGVK